LQVHIAESAGQGSLINDSDPADDDDDEDLFDDDDGNDGDDDLRLTTPVVHDVASWTTGELLSE
jgi:hypothetical protein